jgi:hypothetical protein
MAFNGHVTANNDLDEQQLFLDIPEVARIIGRDARTVRRCVESGEIPGQKFGARWSVPTSWVREQAGITEPPPAAMAPDPYELADRVADRVVARLAGLFTRGACGDGQDPEAV